MSLIKSFPVLTISALALAACGGPASDAGQSSEPSATANAPEETVEVSAEPATPEVNPFEALPAPYDTADFNRGKRVFKLCSSCHILKEGGGNLVGPNLHGMFDRKVGEVDGFGYSKALQEADFEWTPEQLDAWLVSPQGFLKGNNMAFSGVRKEEDRIAVIAYIMAETGYDTAE